MLLLLNGCHKAIPTTVERLDAALRLSTIANRLAHRHQTRIQGSIGDELLGPQVLKELIFGDDTLAMANQVVQHLKDFRAQLDGFATAGEVRSAGYRGYSRQTRSAYPMPLRPDRPDGRDGSTKSYKKTTKTLGDCHTSRALQDYIEEQHQLSLHTSICGAISSAHQANWPERKAMRAIQQFRTFNRPVQLLLINQFAIMIGFSMLMPYLTGYLTTTLGFAAWAAGLVLGLRTFSQQGLSVIGGTLADHVGYKLVIASGCVLRMAGFLLFAFSDALPSVLVAALLSGLGGALFGPAVRAYLASESGERRVEAFALFQICEGMGACLGPVLGVVLFQIGFQLVCVMASVIFLVLTILQLCYLPRPGGSGDICTSACQVRVERGPGQPHVCGLCAGDGGLLDAL